MGCVRSCTPSWGTGGRKAGEGWYSPNLPEPFSPLSGADRVRMWPRVAKPGQSSSSGASLGEAALEDGLESDRYSSRKLEGSLGPGKTVKGCKLGSGRMKSGSTVGTSA